LVEQLIPRGRRSHARTVLILATVVLLGGCAAATPQPRQPERPAPPSGQTAPTPPGQASPAPDPVPERPATAPAPAPGPTLALQRESAHAAAAGDYYRAIALLERAIRIQPADPQLWLDLARVHLRQGAHPEAEQFARKALSLTRGNYTLEQDAWVLIDQARGHGAGTSP
jgi:hypothetical protein